MKNQITFSDLEDYLRTAIKLSKFKVGDIADNVLMSRSGMYCFTNKQNHISISKGDEIIGFLMENDPMALSASANIHFDDNRGNGAL